MNYFIKKGWAVYNSDAVERGRSGWAMYPDVFQGEPVFLTKADPFSSEGARAHLRQISNDKVAKGHGRFLNYIQRHHPHLFMVDPQERLIPQIVKEPIFCCVRFIPRTFGVTTPYT